MLFYSRIGVHSYLTQAQRENNAKIIYKFFAYYGATLQAICGMLGNWQWESGLNPGCKQGSSTALGWGLIQWTPSTVLTRWCNWRRYYWYDGYAQCYRVWCEGTNQLGAGGQWIPTVDYPYTWNDFLSMTDITLATKAWLYERGRGAPETLHEAERIAYAQQWYNYFTSNPLPTIPPLPLMPKRRIPLYLLTRKEI